MFCSEFELPWFSVDKREQHERGKLIRSKAKNRRKSGRRFCKFCQIYCNSWFALDGMSAMLEESRQQLLCLERVLNMAAVSLSHLKGLTAKGCLLKGCLLI